MSWKCLLPLAVCLVTTGCNAIDTHRLELKTYETMNIAVFVGEFYDHRSQLVGDDENAPLERGEVRVPPSEIRSVLADSLARSGLFRAVVNPPARFAGQTPNEMVDHAQKVSDYLLVAEINQLHLKSLGFNWRASFSLPADILMAPISMMLYIMSAGNHMVWTGGFVGCWTAEVVFSVSVSLVDVNTGSTVRTFRLEERARLAHDARDAFGVMWDEDDDWLDLGRRLAEIAVHNAGIRLVEMLAAEPLLKSKGAPSKPSRPER